MKKLALTILTLIVITSAYAQAPQALNYQAVARNSLGQIVPSQSIVVLPPFIRRPVKIVELVMQKRGVLSRLRRETAHL